MDLSSWTPRNLPSPTIFSGRYVRLEPLNPSLHSDELYSILTTPEAQERQKHTINAAPVDREAFLEYLQKAVVAKDALTFVAFDIASGRMGGKIGYTACEVENGAIQIGGVYWSDALARKSGGTEAVYLMVKHVFEDLGYRRIGKFLRLYTGRDNETET